MALETTLVIILTVLAVNLTFQAFRLPVVLGYIIAGAAAGPHGLGLVSDIHVIQKLAEFGVVLLMFSIGLEFSLSRLKLLRFPVFVLGSLQVFITIFITAVIGLIFNLTMIQALIIGGVVCMSSTALVVKQLIQQKEAFSTHGLNALGILLFQDLAFIPFLIVITGLGSFEHQPIWFVLSWSLLKGLFSVILILLVGRYLLQPLFQMIKRVHDDEIFTLAVLFVALGAAWFTECLGMTYALGAFMSGIMLGETEFRLQIRDEIRPFRDVLLGLFFVSIGMLTNLYSWLDTWYWIAIILFAMIFGKAIIVILLNQATGYSRLSAMRTGIVLAQGGEFGFVLLGVAMKFHLLPPSYGQVVLAAIIISLVLASVFVKYNEKEALWFLQR